MNRHSKIFWAVITFAIVGCGEKNKEHGVVLDPGITTDGAGTGQAHQIKYSVEESEYAFAVAQHIQAVTKFDNDELNLSQCYDWKVVASEWSHKISRYGYVDSKNTQAKAYVDSLTSAASEGGKTFEDVIGQIITNPDCPFSGTGKTTLSDFRKSLNSYIGTLEKLKLAGQYGYIQLRERNYTEVRRPKFFFKKAMDNYRLFTRVVHNEPLTDARIGKLLTLLAETQSELEFSYGEIMDDLDDHDFILEQHLMDVMLLVHEIEMMPKKSRGDLRRIAMRTADLYPLAGHYTHIHSIFISF